jgi:hypothetical protein
MSRTVEISEPWVGPLHHTYPSHVKEDIARAVFNEAMALDGHVKPDDFVKALRTLAGKGGMVVLDSNLILIV